MVRDTSGGDTTGIYYQVITPGKGARVNYTDNVSFVYTIYSFDGKYVSADTITNHYDEYLGHVSPNGLMLGICNGFQALVKLGLLPYGRISEMDDARPTLTSNEFGRHSLSNLKQLIYLLKNHEKRKYPLHS